MAECLKSLREKKKNAEFTKELQTPATDKHLCKPELEIFNNAPPYSQAVLGNVYTSCPQSVK